MPAETFRDSWGIPHLRADSADELAFLQGRNAATDRSWQIEMERWRSEGRTAEQFGASGIEWDTFARQSRLDDTARQCFAALDAETRRWCEAYVGGVNRALEDGRRGAPEFTATATSPEPWQPWTPLGVFLVHHILFASFPNKLWRAHVAATLGPGAVDLFSIEAPVWSGSNAWAVHGSLSASGAPLVAGDPHRLLELPGVYQQVRLACPEFDVVGLAFPGVPGLPHFGHAGSVAWGITNAMSDYQDLFSEELRRTASGVEARGSSGWEPAASRVETVAVRGAEPVTVEVIETARGPVISGRPDGAALSLRTPARVERTLGFEALLPLLRSRSCPDVQAALRQWVEPVNSVLAADTSGGILQFVAGRVPRRDRENRRWPVPAWSSRHQWTGEYEELPASSPHPFAVSANDRAAGGGELLGMEFAPAHRARRIRELLEGAGASGGLRLDVAGMQQIHSDTQLGPWPASRRLLAGLARGGLSAPAIGLLDRLLGWDGRMDADSPDAGAFAAWRAALVRGIAADDALAGVHAPTGFPALFGPWTAPVSRVGFALETILDDGARHGIDVARAAADALEASAVRDEAPWAAPTCFIPCMPSRTLAGPPRFRPPSCPATPAASSRRRAFPASPTAPSAAPLPGMSGTSLTGTTAAGWFRSGPRASPNISISPASCPCGPPETSSRSSPTGTC